MDAQQINARLCERATDVVRHLFPSVTFKGNESMVGDISGTPGESLKIAVKGAKIGFWEDFSTNQRGRTFTSLWCEARAKECGKAFKEMREFLGIRPTDNMFYPPRAPHKVIKPTKERALVDGSRTMGYLVSERGLTPNTLKAYRVAQMPEDDCIVFPSFDADGTSLLHMKYLKIERSAEGKKKSWTTSETACVLFGKQAVNPSGGDLVITEGEIDSMSMYQMGYPAVSIPFGAGSHEKWIDNDYEWLQNFSRILLCMDSDSHGFKARNEIAKRLGHHRCFIVTLPNGMKDANDVLLAEAQADLFDAMESAATIDPPQLRTASDFWEDTKEVRFPSRLDAVGIPFLFSIPWNIRPKEVTVWTGYNFHGKSQLLNLAMVYLRSTGQPVCVASFEVEPPVTLDLMTCQAMGRIPAPSEQKEYQAVFDWLATDMLIVNRVGIIPWKELLEIMRYAALRYRIKQFVIDSLLRCGIGQEDLQAQKDFLDALTIFSLDNECHVHLVAHSKKPQSGDESRAPSKYDIKGTGDISDLAHNVVCVHRNLEKQEKKEKAKGPLGSDILTLPDGHFYVYKQRRTGRMSKTELFHLGGSFQFQDKWDKASTRYAPEYQII